MIASYRQAVQWIAENDNPGDDEVLDVETVNDMITVKLVGDVWGKPSEVVARAVVACRKKKGIQ